MIYKIISLDQISYYIKDVNKWHGYIHHHFYRPKINDYNKEESIIRRVDKLHRFGWPYKEKGIWKFRKGWQHGLGYHIVIGPSGNIYISKRWVAQLEGAHCRGMNPNWIGLCWAGDYSNEIPNETMINSAIQIQVINKVVKKIPIRNHLHSDFADTTCPGLINRTLLNRIESTTKNRIEEK